MAEENRKRILVVEDEQFLRELYVQLLKEEGYEVEEAADGEIASDKMSKGGYDLVLLDIVLPKKDGLQILKDLEKTPPVVPNKAVVIMSNLDKESAVSEGVSLGVRGHLIKSDYNPDQFITEMKRILES